MTTNATHPTLTVAPRWPRTAILSAAIALSAITHEQADARAAQRAPQSQLFVTNCDDSGGGSLRDTIAGAASGDMIDLSELTCSTITLTSGAIEIPQDDLTIKYSGEGGTPPTIDGNLQGRVFHHTGSGTLQLVGLTITNGKYDNTDIYYSVPASGGCVYSAGNVYLAGSTVTSCTAQDTRGENAAGGGIYSVLSLTLEHSIVSADTATSNARFADGGGAFAHGAVNVYYSSISGNVASGLAYLNVGGGIAEVNFGSTPSTIANSTIEGNRADRGGGLLISGGGTSGAAITITNSTISGNTGNVYAAAAYFRGPVTLVASTIAFNTSAMGPAVELASHTDPAQIESSILADNDNADFEYDIGARGYTLTVAGSHSLVIDAASGIALPADTIASDPLLLPLADNGGETPTHALGDGSPAIDSGDNVDMLEFDQRGTGYPRVSGAAADIGAYERQSGGDTIFADGFDGAAKGIESVFP